MSTEAIAVRANTAQIARERWLAPDRIVMAGAVVALLVLVVYPAIFLVWGSVSQDGVFTLEHFQRAFSSALYYNALLNTVYLGLGVAGLSVLWGLPIAWAVSRTTMPAKGLVRALVGVSYITPPFLSSIAYVVLLAPNAGAFNQLFKLMGFERGPFNAFTLPTMIFVTSLHTFPFVFLLVSSALESIDASLEQSAQILGAGRLKNTLSITLPLVMPAILAGALLAFVNAISLFGSQAILGLPGRVFTLPTRIYALFNYPPQYGLASALSMMLVILTLAGLYVQHRYLQARSYVTVGGKGARPDLIDLGRGRYLPLVYCALVFGFSVALPYVFLLVASFTRTWSLGPSAANFTLENYQFVLFGYEATWRAIRNSIVLASLAATLAISIGAVIAYIDIRTELPGRQLLDYLSLVPFGLPGIVLAVAIVQAWLGSPINIYGTLVILLLAYLTRFIPVAVRAANASLRQVDGSLEETARITGASWLRTFAQVTLPLTRSGLLAGWILVFVASLHEVSATILLFTGPTITLAVASFNLYDNGLLEKVCAMAVLTMVLTTLVLLGARRFSARRGGATSQEQLQEQQPVAAGG
ncbi:MAG: iron ABC transporter permease [Chloroflexota bacterium]